jgi:uncharacterized oxidoreductase
MILTGHTIFITGGTSGIGLALAEQFLQLKNNVIICGRRLDRLRKLNNQYKNLTVYQADLANADERLDIASKIICNHHSTNILINNAGVQYHNSIVSQFDLNKANNEIAINLSAPVHLSALFIEHFKSKKFAAIVNITSGLGYVPISYMPVYCATKAAMNSITISLRHQLNDTNVKVFCIVPPSVDTELGHQNRDDANKTHGGMPVKEFIDTVLLGLSNDNFEIVIGEAQKLKNKPDEMFHLMNK